MTVNRSPFNTNVYHFTRSLSAQSTRPMFIKSSLMVLTLSTLLFGLSGCDVSSKQTESDDLNSVKTTNHPPNTAVAHAAQPDTSKVATHNTLAESTVENPLQIDWSQVDSKVTSVDADTFKYPFEINSKAVESYATFFNVTPKQAQHNLTVGTASNEPLTHLLDQLGKQYLSHELTNGKDVKLIVHTTATVAPSHYDYVIADDFAHGLILPIEIQPKADSNEAVSSH